MHLFFQLQNLQLIIFCMDGQECKANFRFLKYFSSSNISSVIFPSKRSFFFCNIIKTNHFLYCVLIMLHLISFFLLTKSLLVPYAYVPIKSIDRILLSSFELKTILLISSVQHYAFHF